MKSVWPGGRLVLWAGFQPVQARSWGVYAERSSRSCGSIGAVCRRQCLVVAFLGTECPLAKLYGRDCRVWPVSSSRRGRSSCDQLESAGLDRRDFALCEAARDSVSDPQGPGQKVADQFRATRTPEVFVLSPVGEVLYRGRIDDQYIVGVQRDKPQREDLKLALVDILAGSRSASPRPSRSALPDPAGA